MTLSAAALGATAAHGAVVVTDFPDVTTTGRYNWVDLIFNTATGVANTAVMSQDQKAILFDANGYDSKFGWTGAYAMPMPQGTRVSGSDLDPGDMVNSSMSLTNGNVLLASNLIDGYYGVLITAGDGNHYGWVKLSTGPDAGGKGPTSVTLKAAAIETTAGVGITIPSAVPEPSSVLLLGLAAGAGAFRRRRSQAA